MGGEILKTVSLEFSFKEFCHKIEESKRSREDFFSSLEKKNIQYL